MPSQDRIDRREFAAQLAFRSSALTVTALSAASLTSQAVRGEEPASASALSPENRRSTDKTGGKPADGEEPPVELLLLSYLVRRYPSDKYDEQALQGIFRDILGDVARGRQLSEYPLTNSDAPAFVFTAYRGP